MNEGRGVKDYALVQGLSWCVPLAEVELVVGRAGEPERGWEWAVCKCSSEREPSGPASDRRGFLGEQEVGEYNQPIGNLHDRTLGGWGHWH